MLTLDRVDGESDVIGESPHRKGDVDLVVDRVRG